MVLISLIFFVFLLSQNIVEINSSNWAQASGAILQDTVIPYLASPSTPHWAARYGMVTVVAPPNSTTTTSVGKVYLMGGDSFNGANNSNAFAPGLLDLRWENGYKNDVWIMSGTEWYVKGDPRLRTHYHNKIPRVYSKLHWNLVTPGLHPNPGETYDYWIRCEPYFQNIKGISDQTCSGSTTNPVQWSPRRHHAGVFFNGYVYVMGGRAREFMDFLEDRSVGGIIGPHVQDMPDTQNNNQQLFTTQREASVYKSDVWRSIDGKKWELVTPGCKVPQASLIASGNPYDGKYGVNEQACQTDADCYGAAVCDPTKKTCICMMWSPREQHAVAVYGGYMYLSGGYTSVLYTDFSDCGLYACGDTDASAYRYYLSDIWRSSDGQSWTLITEKAFSEGSTSNPIGRGGHQMLAFPRGSPTGPPHLWVFGGRTGDNTYQANYTEHLNDIWVSSIVESFPFVWEELSSSNSWSPRTGHQVVLETASPQNLNIRTLYLAGGYSDTNNVSTTFYEDVWTWRLDDPTEDWIQDFTSEAYYSTGAEDTFQYRNNSPTVSYVTPNSNLSMMQQFWVPDVLVEKVGKPLEYREYLTSDKLQMLNSVGLYTINDLATAGLYTILKLRGFDIPQVTNRLTFYDICDYRALAIAITNKCSVTIPPLYLGANRMPWAITPVFGGAPPQAAPAAWHGITNYSFLDPPSTDPTVILNSWDGCTYEPLIEGLFGPNVNGLGYVSQVSSIQDPTPILDNIFCKQSPGARAYHAMVYFEERVYLFGGKQSNATFYADTWYRDSYFPQTTITKKPRSGTSDNWFELSADKPGTTFEYRVWDPYKYNLLRDWTPTVKQIDISFLNWRKKGPGNGNYRVYVRAVDAANNREAEYVLGRNVYDWNYVSPTPYDIIFISLACFLTLCFLLYLEYRRRVKKAAMERYAMKRMRRKFKAMQRDINGKAVDWRTLYLESKEAEEAAGLVKKVGKKKKKRDKLTDKREKEKKKREKEKEKIKMKLKANKELKKNINLDQVVPLDDTAQLEAEDAEGAGLSTKKKTTRSSKGSKSTAAVAIIDLDEEKAMDLDDKDGKAGRKKKKGGGNRTNKLIAVDDLEEKDDIESFVIERDVSPGGDKKKKSSTNKKKGKSNDILEEFSSKEVRSKSSMAETGTKQRRVNKRLKVYEEGAEAEELKKTDEPDANKKDPTLKKHI